MSMLAGCFGLDQWRTILHENYEANRQHELEIAQEKAELSESLFPNILQLFHSISLIYCDDSHDFLNATFLRELATGWCLPQT